MLRLVAALFGLLLLLSPHLAMAYIGPGSGVGLLGSLWAWLAGIVVVLMAILFWPLRWALRRLRARNERKPPAGE